MWNRAINIRLAAPTLGSDFIPDRSVRGYMTQIDEYAMRGVGSMACKSSFINELPPLPDLKSSSRLCTRSNQVGHTIQRRTPAARTDNVAENDVPVHVHTSAAVRGHDARATQHPWSHTFWHMRS